MVAASISALLLGLSTPAHAAPTSGDDYAIAVADTAVLNAQSVAQVALYNAEDPDITCDNPVVAGAAVTPATNFVVGNIYGNDVATGTGHCASFQEPFNATLVVIVEYMDGRGGWNELHRSLPMTMPSIHGVSTPTVAPFLTTYESTHPAAGRPHRVRGELTNTVNGRMYPGIAHVILTPDESLVADDARIGS